MQRNRIILAILWLLSVAGISFYGGPVSYGLFTVLTLIPVISLLYLLLVFMRFKMYQEFTSPGIVCNHPVPFYFTLQNEDLFAFSGVRVTFHSDFSHIDGLSDRTEYELLPHSRIKKETNLLCHYRGEYEVGIRSVVLQDFFRLFRLTYQNREPLKAIVKPDIIVLDQLENLDMDSVSDRPAPHSARSLDSTIRSYIPGDDIRRIHWKQTARLGQLCVRNMTGEEKAGIGMILNTRKISEDPAVYLPSENRILETAIALTLFFKNKNIPVDLYWQEHEKPKQLCVDSADAFSGFYDAMSALSFDTDLSEEPFYEDLILHQHLYQKQLLILITPDINEEAAVFAQKVTDNDCDLMICHISDEEKKDLPFEKSTITVRSIPTSGDLGKYL
ncbi:MAG: DUF58 domain-containing protein [Lachnospiraceae bacterium]|nr:DUF58 domain-containing protein [Lachnospiraceae bacterium]